MRQRFVTCGDAFGLYFKCSGKNGRCSEKERDVTRLAFCREHPSCHVEDHLERGERGSGRQLGDYQQSWEMAVETWSWVVAGDKWAD